MGDVAMMVQTVWNVLENNPTAQITVVTRPLFHCFFGSHERLHFFPLDLKNNHKGFKGLVRLAGEIKKLKPTVFIDEHDVLRSKIVRSKLKLSGIPTYVFNKGRKEKQGMLKKETELRQLMHSIDRYNDPLKKIGLTISDDYQFTLPTQVSAYGVKKSKYRIGFAPFSAHDSKEWGLENTTELLDKLNVSGDYEVLLFGGGKREQQLLDDLQKDFDHVENVAGYFSLKEELSVMKTCDLFIAMDSSNMHLADLVGCKVLSIWISTHPYFGFYAKNNSSNSIVVDSSAHPLVPLSIFGKVAKQEKLDAVNSIRESVSPELVLERINRLLA